MKLLYLPETLYNADLLVSMPKLKTHHWAGATLSLKNMFGVIPGTVYGWPKNILHWQGIHQSILDINSSLPLPQFAIVDGIVGMEGNGPLQGEPKASGVLIFGDDLVAVDASATRLMMLEPRKIKYLARSRRFPWNFEREKIEQSANGSIRCNRTSGSSTISRISKNLPASHSQTPRGLTSPTIWQQRLNRKRRDRQHSRLGRSRNRRRRRE